MKKVLCIMLAALMMLSVFSIMAFSLSYDDITFISIKDVVAPVAGKKPSYTYTNNGSHYHFCDEYEGDYDGAVKNCMVWYDTTASKNVLPTDTFQAGHKYTATFYLIADDGYWFPETVDEVFVNGIDSQGMFFNGEMNHSFRFMVICEFPVVDEIITSISVTGIITPTKGAAPVYSASVSSSEYSIATNHENVYVKNGVEWYDATTYENLKTTDKFQAGHKYTASVYLKAKDGYTFPEIVSNITINGKAAKGVFTDVTATEYDDEYYVYLEFPEIVDDTTPINFPDVPSNAWYYDAVQYCAQRGFITGYKNGKFGPGDNLQRQDFVVILARIADADLAFYTYCNLKDVDMKAYYGPAVAWAQDNDIVNGYTSGAKAGKFGVGDNITREQVATILYRFMGAPAAGSGNIMNSFPDRSKVSDFADEAMIWAVNNGIISGKNGKLAPQDNASRAEIATMIMRMDKAGMF